MLHLFSSFSFEERRVLPVVQRVKKFKTRKSQQILSQASRADARLVQEMISCWRWHDGVMPAAAGTANVGKVEDSGDVVAAVAVAVAAVAVAVAVAVDAGIHVDVGVAPGSAVADAAWATMARSNRPSPLQPMSLHDPVWTTVTRTKQAANSLDQRSQHSQHSQRLQRLQRLQLIERLRPPRSKQRQKASSTHVAWVQNLTVVPRTTWQDWPMQNEIPPPLPLDWTQPWPTIRVGIGPFHEGWHGTDAIYVPRLSSKRAAS